MSTNLPFAEKDLQKLRGILIWSLSSGAWNLGQPADYGTRLNYTASHDEIQRCKQTVTYWRNSFTDGHLYLSVDNFSIFQISALWYCSASSVLVWDISLRVNFSWQRRARGESLEVEYLAETRPLGRQNGRGVARGSYPVRGKTLINMFVKNGDSSSDPTKGRTWGDELSPWQWNHELSV
jgi:hypothetical protein